MKLKSKKRKKPNAMIVVEATKKRLFRYVPEYRIPSNSFDKKFNGGYLHVLGCTLKGQLWPIEPRAAKEGKMPTDLYMAKNCANEVEECYGLSMPTSEKIKLGILVGLCVAILVVIFLIAAASGGA